MYKYGMAINVKKNGTSLMNGIRRAFETKPGTSLEVVTSMIGEGYQHCDALCLKKTDLFHKQ